MGINVVRRHCMHWFIRKVCFASKVLVGNIVVSRRERESELAKEPTQCVSDPENKNKQ